MNEKNALASEVQQKSHVASSQRVSGVDAQHINSQLTELKGRLSQADKELVELDHDLGTEEQLYRQEKMSVSWSADFFIPRELPMPSYTVNLPLQSLALL